MASRSQGEPAGFTSDTSSGGPFTTPSKESLSPCVGAKEPSLAPHGADPSLGSESAEVLS